MPREDKGRMREDTREDMRADMRENTRENTREDTKEDTKEVTREDTREDTREHKGGHKGGHEGHKAHVRTWRENMDGGHKQGRTRRENQQGRIGVDGGLEEGADQKVHMTL